MTRLAGRVKRLEENGSGDCPHCAKPVLVRGEREGPSCPVCGRARTVIRVIRDPDFYRNAARLELLGAER
jgi:hypothetical protein